jgi:hypothetical protein
MKTTITIIVMLLVAFQLNAQTATTYSVINVAQTTATLKGHIDPGAGTFYGVEFEIADNSSFTGSSTHGPDEGSNYNSASNISYNVTGLSQNTTYFVRVKVGYSTVTGGGITATSKNFTTLNATVPSVNIGTDFTSITDQSASNSSNEVTGDGGSSVTECGLVVATHSTPSTADTKIAVTSGLGTYNGNITSLNQLTKYYVRAYATNATGNGYSSVTKTFSTLASTNAVIDSMVSKASGELTIYFQKGSGDACIIYMKEGSTITDHPVNGSSYSENTAFGSGDDLGDNTYVVYAQSNAKASSVTVTNLNDASNYYIKTGAYDNTSKTYDITGTELNTKDNSNLPIALISFTGKNTEKGNLLKWTTATEYNNDFFTIERSNDNINFKAIEIMNGAGNSNSIIMYEYLDNSIENNNNYYYRLKQTDFDGKFTYSNSIYVSSKEESLNIISLLNSEDNITLNITNTEAKGIVELIGLDGKIYDSRILKKSDNQSITFNKGEYSHGIYLIKLKNANTVITRKVVL